MSDPMSVSSPDRPLAPTCVQRLADGRGAMLFDTARMGALASVALFDAQAYGARAQRIEGRGGRGSAWFVEDGFGHAVLRHYRRGGFVARFSSDAYLWQGEDAVRSFREFRLAAHLHGLGLPVPLPLAAVYWRSGLGYRAALLMRRIDAAQSFGQLVAERGAGAPWEAVGRALGRLHRIGARHADCNATNILIDAGGQPWVIDWDRGRIDLRGTAWRETVIARLRRSFRKVAAEVADAVITEGMQRLRRAHDAELLP